MDQNKYFINNNPVSAAEFKTFLESLKGQEGWSCDETTEGGTVRYQSTGSDGHRYEVTQETGGKNEQNITKFNEQV